ncbi:hypothetical protein DFH08DRAFT_824610 [Mycena albidolilacea]|uniref:Uncharacterized protein n=1 Tax=Mycena albidolilacea TaxID=1033008 RepID=A0AAD6Z488_9AGAR|nr:hypothetical protein DFH08DRAFT_824610 [Mycena albidolilacea]
MLSCVVIGGDGVSSHHVSTQIEKLVQGGREIRITRGKGKRGNTLTFPEVYQAEQEVVGCHGDTTGIAKDNEERVEKGGSKMTSTAICQNWVDQSGWGRVCQRYNFGNPYLYLSHTPPRTLRGIPLPLVILNEKYSQARFSAKRANGLAKPTNGLASRSAGLGFDLQLNPSPSPNKPIGAGASPFGKPKSELSASIQVT